MATRRRPQSRLEWKLNLTQALFERNLSVDETYQIVDFINWLMVLDDRREALFDTALKDMEEKYQMTSTLPPRQLRLMAKSHEEGKQEGKQEGELATFRANILDVLEIRFGTVSEDIQEHLNGRDDVTYLRNLLRTAARPATLDEFRDQLA